MQSVHVCMKINLLVSLCCICEVIVDTSSEPQDSYTKTTPMRNDGIDQKQHNNINMLDNTLTHNVLANFEYDRFSFH